MHGGTIGRLRHAHDYGADFRRAERRTAWVTALTAVTMLLEITAGIAFGSMALLADGWHMGTHVAAFGIALVAYRYARRHAASERYSFGTGKVTTLGSFASAVALALVAAAVALESALRLLEPRAIRFDEALAVAVFGLAVNVASGLLLRSGPREVHAHDPNLRGAYLHVLADAATSVGAIVALLAGRAYGWLWLDAVTGLAGAALIGRWAWSLARENAAILLDEQADELGLRIRRAIEKDADTRIADLHVWRVAPAQHSAVLSVVTHRPRPPEHYRGLLAELPSLVHVVVEVNECAEPDCAPAARDGRP